MPSSQSKLLLLAIEVSNPSASAGVALGDIGGAALGVERVAPSGRGHDDDLMPAIDRLFRRAGARPHDLARVAVSVGPGGYTGLRVACAAGKMIAAATGAACVSVPTALVVLESLPPPSRTGTIAVALASKNDTAWLQVFDPLSPQSSVLSTGHLASTLPPDITTLIADRFLPAPMRAAAAAAGVTIIEPTFDPAACLRLGARLPTIDPIALVPVYPREPDAVTLWRSRASRS